MEPSAATTASEATEASSNGHAQSAETFDVHRPTDGSVIQSVAIDSPERVAEVVARVRSNQGEWEAMGFAARRRWLGRWRDWMLANREHIADVVQEETGKVRGDSGLESIYLEMAINFWGENGEKYLADESPSPGLVPNKVKRLRVRYRPYPVVGIISPWNFPLILSAGDAIPALMAGSSVVIKPSEFTPLELMEVIRGWKEEVGGPDIIDFVNGTGDTGGALVDNVDYMHFTGSDRTGKIVMKRAADTLTPVSLELGGKDPAIVLADADMDRAVNACAYGGFVNTGQVCMSIERIYVEEPVYDVFVNRLADSVRELRQGADGRSYTAEQGAMTSPAQIDIVSDHVEDAREKGARILTGGKRKDGAGDWYEPTVVADADHSMKVMRDETFGPVVGVMKVKDAGEAIRMANDTRYGLSASVFSGDVDKAEKVAEQLEVGAANINDALVNYFHLEVPMGGWKDSGIGWRHGPGGIRKYCRTETIVSPRMKNTKSEPLWYPYTPGRRKMMNRLYRLINARGLKNRLGIGD
ncbi:MAG TPA: aldehyde dehydrogenase family protein [Solirubrobacterales bacterium]|nr:aldehyde dehydrogenase family protein [Solirubrobacterales bacterium]